MEVHRRREYGVQYVLVPTHATVDLGGRPRVVVNND